MLLKPVLAVAVVVFAVTLYGIVPVLMPREPDGGESMLPFEADQYNNLGGFAAAVKGLGAETPAGEAPRTYSVATLVGSPTVLSGVENPERTVYFVAGVGRDYRAEEVSALIDFTKRGGNLIIADDFGYANTLAQKFGIFYFGTDLWDLEDGRYDKNITLPLVPFTFTARDFTVELNGPTGLTLIANPEVNTTVIAHCSEECYADIDRSGDINIGDKKGNITIIMQAVLQENITVGGASTYVPTKGEAYFISDASIFTNEMLTKPDNSSTSRPGNLEFAKALIANLLPEGGTVVIDESRHLHKPGTQVVYASFETSAIATSKAELAAALIGGAGLVLAVIVLRAKDRDNWIHKFDLSTFHPRTELPETLPVQVQRLRQVARLKIQMTHSMSDEEFAAVPPDQLREMIKDPMLIDLVLNTERPWSPEEIRPAGDHIRAWGK